MRYRGSIYSPPPTPYFSAACVDAAPNCDFLDICTVDVNTAKRLCKQYCHLCDIGKRFIFKMCVCLLKTIHIDEKKGFVLWVVVYRL